MSGGKHIRAVEAGSETDAATQDEAVAEEQATEPELDEWVEEEVEAPRVGWIAPTLAALATLGWSGFFVWAHRDAMLAGATPVQWIEWIGDWSLPVLLVIGAWLLAMRNSRREAARFADAANGLSRESAELETRLVTVNRELSLAREFLASETRELETLGRVASGRLTEHADKIDALVGRNHEQVERIGAISESALANMDRLRDELPVIANSARDTSNQIGAAGESAHEQLERLVSGFERLNIFGQASERQVASLGERVDAALAAFEAQLDHLGGVTTERFDALREASDAYRGELDTREVETLAALRRRMDSFGEETRAASATIETAETEALDTLKGRIAALADEAGSVSAELRASETRAEESWSLQVDALRERLGQAIEEVQALDAQALESAQAKLAELQAEAGRVDTAMAERDAAFLAQVDARREAMDNAQATSISALDERLAALDEALDRRRDRQEAHVEAMRERSEAVLARMGEIAVQADTLATEAGEAHARLVQASEGAANRLAAAREDAETLNPAVQELTEGSVRLLELIQASAQHSREQLPPSLEEAERRLVATRKSGEALQALLGEAEAKSRTVSDYVIATREEADRIDSGLGTLDEKLVALNQRFETEVARLRAMLETLRQDSEATGEHASGVLAAAIAELDEKARAALSLADEDSVARIADLSDSVGRRTADAIEEAIAGQSRESIAALDEAAGKSADAARAAAIQLRDQLAMVNELAGNLENRVALARERAEEQVDNDFARRVALITEALNSNAIDIAKALSSDVTDTAWASYLRGDRGIFTRRAVALIDATEARDIAELYDDDADFRDHVSRYIHDFEAMLRTMLSTRDGNALGVTLLSSDMGKLYVVLAQAIERLRDD